MGGSNCTDRVRCGSAAGGMADDPADPRGGESMSTPPDCRALSSIFATWVGGKRGGWWDGCGGVGGVNWVEVRNMGVRG